MTGSSAYCMDLTCAHTYKAECTQQLCLHKHPGADVPREKVRAVVNYLRALGHDETGGTNDTRWAYKRSADYIQNELLPDESR